jgi:hypothetical protein
MTTEIALIHVRFGNDGGVVEIGERPAPFTAQEWFDWLSNGVITDQYQALSGGRGIFRIARDKVEELRKGIIASKAA